MTLVLLLGGARSGKSTLAQRLAENAEGHVTYVATATAGDAEMAEKIAAHRGDRPVTWETVEEPLDLAAALTSVAAEDTIVLDCLTLWVANLLERGDDREQVVTSATEAAVLASERAGTTVAVSNEVGLGVVPVTPLGRVYRDTLGEVNQAWADRADHVMLVVAGRALPLGDAGELARRLAHGG